MANIQVFEYQNNKVRTVDVNGEAWFVLKDVCEVLGLSTPARVAKRLDGDEVSLTHLTDSMGRQQETTVINESGLYNVILRSDKPEAKPFRKWVTNDVLPTIRKTGSYMMPGNGSSLQALDLLVKSLHEQQDAMNRLQVNVDAQSAAIEKLEEQNELNRQAFSLNRDNWRENANAVVRKIVYAKTGGQMQDSAKVFQETWREVYSRMNARGLNMDKRLANLQKALPGKKLGNLSVIEFATDSKRLINDLHSVLCEMCIYYNVKLDAEKAKAISGKTDDCQTSMYDAYEASIRE